MDEQHPEVGVAAFADPAEPTTRSTGMFFRGEAERTGEMPSGWEAMSVTDECNQSGGGKQTDPGNGTKSLYNGNVFTESLEPKLRVPDMLFHLNDLAASFFKDRSESKRDLGIGFPDPLSDLWDDPFGSQRDKHSQLSKDSSERIDPCSTIGHPSGSKSMESSEGLLIH